MEERIKFIKEYASFYKVERYTTLIVSILTLLVLIGYFSFQLIANKNPQLGITIANGIVGLGSAGILSTAIGYIFKFMDKVNEAADKHFNNM
jgi:uncharacterized membrane protein (DUF485 family)